MKRRATGCGAEESVVDNVTLIRVISGILAVVVAIILVIRMRKLSDRGR